jgi:hypothetical protein
LSTYADTGFLVSLYVLDANSALAATKIKQAKLPILLTPFGELALELANACSYVCFEKSSFPPKSWRLTLCSGLTPRARSSN